MSKTPLAGLRSSNLDELEGFLKTVSTQSLPAGIAPISVRALLLTGAKSLSPEALLVCLEIFSAARIPDPLFFKGIDKYLVTRVKELSLPELCRLLKAHAAVGVSESIVFPEVYARLRQVINRANPGEVLEILASVSKLQSSSLDCSNIAELCLNRYSLSRSSKSVPYSLSALSLEATERGILRCLAGMGIQHRRTIRKILSQVRFDPSILSADDAVELFTYMHALGIDCEPQFRAMREAIRSNLSRMAPSLRAATACASYSYKTIHDPELIVRSAATQASSSTEHMTKDQAVWCMKHRLALQTLASLDFSSLHRELTQLSIPDLEKILTVVSDESAGEKPAKHFACTKLDLKNFRAGGLFASLLLTKNKFK